jgi:hypothetical protein
MIDNSHNVRHERELPRGHLAARRDHLVREIRRPDRRTRAGLLPARSRVYALIGAMVGGIAVLATPAFGIGERLARLVDRDPGFPAIVTDELRKGPSVAIAGGKEAALWTGPTTDGGLCVFLHTSDSAAAAPPTVPNGGGSCTIGPPRPQPMALRAGISWSSMDGRVIALLDGHVAPDRGITSVQVHTASGTQSLPLRDGYFLAELTAEAIGELAGPHEVVAYDRAGNEVARVDLQQLITQTSP